MDVGGSDIYRKVDVKVSGAPRLCVVNGVFIEYIQAKVQKWFMPK